MRASKHTPSTKTFSILDGRAGGISQFLRQAAFPPKTASLSFPSKEQRFESRCEAVMSGEKVTGSGVESNGRAENHSGIPEVRESDGKRWRMARKKYQVGSNGHAPRKHNRAVHLAGADSRHGKCGHGSHSSSK